MNGQLIKRLLTNAPVAPLVQRLELEPDLWKQNTWRQNYVVKIDRPISPQQDTEAVMFRWAAENTIESVRDSLNIQVHPNMEKFKELHELLIVCLGVAGAVECGRVFIAKLKPGGIVLPHCDYGKYSDHFERFHLVLKSDPGNEFFVKDPDGNQESAYMKPGEFYWFNHKEEHWAVNNSATPRMHLIIDCVAPQFRRERVSVCP